MCSFIVLKFWKTNRTLEWLDHQVSATKPDNLSLILKIYVRSGKMTNLSCHIQTHTCTHLNPWYLSTFNRYNFVSYIAVKLKREKAAPSGSTIRGLSPTISKYPERMHRGAKRSAIYWVDTKRSAFYWVDTLLASRAPHVTLALGSGGPGAFS